MEFRQLEAFQLVVDSGNFSETANLMGISQPSVSSYISALEREFGCQLLIRQPGKAVLTDTGKTLYQYAVELLSLRNKAVATCGRHKEMSGTISIAASSIPYRFVLPVLAAQFSLKHPDSQFDFVGADSAGAIEMVLREKVDLGMAGTLLSSEELEYLPVLEDELVVLTPAKPPFTLWPREPVQVETLLDIPFVAREEGSGTRAEVRNYLEHQGYDGGALRVVATMDNPDAIIKAVEQGLGITILSSLAANEYLRKGDVLVAALANNPAKRKIYLVRKKAKRLPIIAEAFARFAARQTSDE